MAIGTWCCILCEQHIRRRYAGDVDIEKDVASALQVPSLLPRFTIRRHYSEAVTHSQVLGTDQAITLESAQSAAWTCREGRRATAGTSSPATGDRSGSFNAETRQTGSQIIQSLPGAALRAGESMVCRHRSAWLIKTTEEEERAGAVLGATGLERQLAHQRARQSADEGGAGYGGGFNPFDFGYRLKPGEQLETPPSHGGYTSEGKNGPEQIRGCCTASNASTFSLAERALRLRPSLHNSWESDGIQCQRDRRVGPGGAASKLGVERFVIDDGSGSGQRRTTMPASATGM